MPLALITGASAGLGLELARGLAGRGWNLLIDGRDERALDRASAVLGIAAAESGGGCVAIAGDVADPAHRTRLSAAIGDRLDLLVNNASELGPSPLPALAGYPLAELARVFQVNVFAPLALIQAALPALQAARGVILNLSSDAAVEAYPGWGGYGSSKAALDQLSAVLSAEQPSLRVYAVDPGDLRTAMHQRAFPGEDISDRPLPSTVVPALLRLLDSGVASGRYPASRFAAGVNA